MSDTINEPPCPLQRREAFRLDAALRIILRREHAGIFPRWYEPEDYEAEEDTRTIDISETGLSFRTKEEYTPGERLYARVYINQPGESEPPLEFTGEVKRSDHLPPEKEEKRVGLQFKGTDEETGRMIARLLRLRQQIRLRQRQLSTDNRQP